MTARLVDFGVVKEVAEKAALCREDEGLIELLMAVKRKFEGENSMHRVLCPGIQLKRVWAFGRSRVEVDANVSEEN